MKTISKVVVSIILSAAVSATAHAAVTTERVSLNSIGNQIAQGTYSYGDLSADGRYIVFDSADANVVAGDTNGSRDVFLRDCQTGTVELISVHTNGTLGNGHSHYPYISNDGRYVVFESAATNLVAGDVNARNDIFLRDRVAGTTVRCSVVNGTPGTGGNDSSEICDISADGRYVLFASGSTNLVAGDTNGMKDVFRYDRDTQAVIRVSVSSADAEGEFASSFGKISGDGNIAIFYSSSTNLVAGDTNSRKDLFYRNISAGTTVRANVAQDGTQANNTGNVYTSLSDDGTIVCFATKATSLTADGGNGNIQLFKKNMTNGEITLVSKAPDNTLGNGGSGNPSVSADGRYIAYVSSATNLIAGDTNGQSDVFRYDSTSGETVRISLKSDGTQGDGYSGYPCISTDGQKVVYYSDATNLVAGDTNAAHDLFLSSLPPTPTIPTLNEWGMIIMATLMAGYVLVMRRRENSSKI